MRVGWLLSSEPLQLFVVEEGLDPQVIVHPKSLKLLRQGEVGENHIMDLGRKKSVFIKRDQICYDYLLSRQVVPSRPLWSWPSDGVHPTGRLESAAVEHWHVWVDK